MNCAICDGLLSFRRPAGAPPAGAASAAPPLRSTGAEMRSGARAESFGRMSGAPSSAAPSMSSPSTSSAGALNGERAAALGAPRAGGGPRLLLPPACPCWIVSPLTNCFGRSAALESKSSSHLASSAAACASCSRRFASSASLCFWNGVFFMPPTLKVASLSDVMLRTAPALSWSACSPKGSCGFDIPFCGLRKLRGAFSGLGNCAERSAGTTSDATRLCARRVLSSSEVVPDGDDGRLRAPLQPPHRRPRPARRPAATQLRPRSAPNRRAASSSAAAARQARWRPWWPWCAVAARGRGRGPRVAGAAKRIADLRRDGALSQTPRAPPPQPRKVPDDAMLKLAASGIDRLNALQLAAVEPALRGLDVIVHAETGSGRRSATRCPSSPRSTTPAQTCRRSSSRRPSRSRRKSPKSSTRSAPTAPPRCARATATPPARRARRPSASPPRPSSSARRRCCCGCSAKRERRSCNARRWAACARSSSTRRTRCCGRSRHATHEQKERRESHPKEAATLLKLLCEARGAGAQVLAASATVGRPLRREIANLAARPFELIRAPDADAPPPADGADGAAAFAASAAAAAAPAAAGGGARGRPAVDARPPVVTTDGDNFLHAVHTVLATEKPSRPLVFVPAGRAVSAEVKLLQDSGLPGARALINALDDGIDVGGAAAAPVAVAVAEAVEAVEAVVAPAQAPPAAGDTIEVEVAEAPGLPPAWVGAKVVEAVEGGSFKVEVNGDAEWVEEYTADDEGSEWRWEAADPATAAAAAIEGDDEGDGEAAERWSGPLLVAGVSEARGIDVPGVDLVLIVGVPPSADSLLHLAGRTARNGAAGRAVVVGTPTTVGKLAALGPQLDIDLAAQTSHLAERDERLADTWRVHSKKYEQ